MKAARTLLISLVLVLTACTLPTAAVAPAASAPLAPAGAVTSFAPGARLATRTPPPGATSVSARPMQSTRTIVTGATTAPAVPSRALAPFSIGVPAGDAYGPMSIAIDSARNLAYVYHADSAERRPVISVVDLKAGRVTQVIRLEQTTPGASGRLFLTPDGKRLFLQETQNKSVLSVDIASGRVRKVLEGVNDAVLSDDGKVLYAVLHDIVAAYPAADLAQGETRPIWQAETPFTRIELNGNRLLATSYGGAGALVALDAATGKEIARSSPPASADVISPGPNGGWAVVAGGEKSRLVRYDADLNVLGETPVSYTGAAPYDTVRNRYLMAGSRYTETEPAGHPVILSIDAQDGKLVDEVPLSGGYPLTAFAPWGRDAIVAFATGGPGALYVLDAETLQPKQQIVTGVRATEAVVDGISRLYVADDTGRIHVLQLPGGQEVALWQGAGPLALDKQNQRLYANREGRVVALSLRDGSVAAQFPQGGSPAPDPNADLVYIADRGVTIYNRSGAKLGTLPSTFPAPTAFSGNPYAVAAQVNPVTGHVAVILHNGIPGSNGGTFLRIYPRQSDAGVTPPGPHSFVLDLETDRAGNWYVAYSTARTQEAVHLLSPAGQPQRKLEHRTGFEVLDEVANTLYLFADGRITTLSPSTLGANLAYAGPDVFVDPAYSPGLRTAYVPEYTGSHITAVDLDALAPLDLRPVPARPSPEAYNEGVTAVGGGRQRLLLSRYGTAYRTSNGTAWEQLVPGLDMYYTHVTAVDPQTIFVAGRSAAGGEGVWRSTDGGSTWAFLSAGLTDLLASGPVLANSANEAYFVNASQGLFRWDPAGSKWALASAGPPEGQWGSLSLAPDGALFRSNNGSLERSMDRGASWQKLGATEKTGDVIGYSSLYTVTQTLFSVVRKDYRPAAINRSTDAGKTWQPSLGGPLLGFDGYQPEITTGFGRSYLLLQPYSGPARLLRTVDYGATWEVAPVETAPDAQHLAVDPLDGRLWLGVKGGLRSIDPGNIRWTRAPLAATPTATPVPTATVAPCTATLNASDAETSGRAPGIGCPKGAPAVVQMARQRFQHGQMIWRGDRKQVYVLSDDGRWQGYEDKWVEGDPTDDPTLQAPASLQQPGRGFGKVWREQLGGPKSALGWALEKEQGVQGQAQDWDHATVLRFGGELIALSDNGRWQ